MKTAYPAHNAMFRTIFAFISVSACLQSLAAENYKGPIDLQATKDGNVIHVVNKDASEIAVFNTANDRILKTLALGDGFHPQGAVLSADEKTLYITGGGHHGRVLAVDISSGTLTHSAIAGHTPTGAVITPDGTRLFVCNQFSNTVGEYSLPDLTLTRTIKAVREPRSAIVTQDGKHILVANLLPLMPTNFLEDRDAGIFPPNETIYVAAEITVIDTESGAAKSIRNLPNGSGILSGMCLSPDGRYVYITATIARFLNRTSHVERGWINTAGIIILDTTKLADDPVGNAFVNAVLLDDIVLGAPSPWGITTSADGTKIYVAIAGSSELMVVDAIGMHQKLAANPRKQQPQTYLSPYSVGNEVWDDLSFLDGLKTRVNLPGKGARAIARAHNDIYVGMYFSDTLQKIDPATLQPLEIALGPVPIWTQERRGEVWWNDATLCFQHWQSCASCHPDARTDGHNWDLLNDGHGNPKKTKSLLFSHLTPPSMWQAVRDNPYIGGWDTDTMGLQCVRTGFTHILFSEPDEEISRDIDAYLRALQPVPSPYLVDGKLSEKAMRGKLIFEDRQVGCIKCHPAPLFTDKRLHNVKSRAFNDRTDYFDTPTLREVWRNAPYLHDGRYVNMHEVFKHGRHGGTAGNVAGLTDVQIDDLVEYVLSL
ncbi:MAG: hypothetical protein FWG73_06800 [Planctomycetaceae bacterium]|nr:hypothetical protein [Planctomycetaceae bacterium]